MEQEFFNGAMGGSLLENGGMESRRERGYLLVVRRVLGRECGRMEKEWSGRKLKRLVRRPARFWTLSTKIA